MISAGFRVFRFAIFMASCRFAMELCTSPVFIGGCFMGVAGCGVRV
jgi:hypothetical protein